MKDEIAIILTTFAPAEIVERMVDAFIDLERSFVLKQWKSGGLDAGHFVEMVRRYLDHVLSGTYTPVGARLPNLTEGELARLAGHESHRVLIPRVLLSIYGVRNKRGIGHVSEITANGMDANLILASCKWVLAELLRVSSNRSIEETGKLVEALSSRYIDGFWTEAGIERVLLSNISAREKALFYLFNKSPAVIGAIERATQIEPKYLRRIARELDSEGLVHFDEPSRVLTLSPYGHSIAEGIVQKSAIRVGTG